ncbi:MAG: hypothetical protein O9264_16515 [Leptospira sp.]|nr:hypothetical protein [Leptospira sp.]
MTRIILEAIDPQAVNQIRELARRLDVSIIEEVDTESEVTKTQKALQYLKDIADAGGLQDRISDPKQWKQTMRTDRNLPGRV